MQGTSSAGEHWQYDDWGANFPELLILSGVCTKYTQTLFSIRFTYASIPWHIRGAICSANAETDDSPWCYASFGNVGRDASPVRAHAIAAHHLIFRKHMHTDSM